MLSISSLASRTVGVKRAITNNLSGGLATQGFYTEAMAEAVPTMHRLALAHRWKDKCITWKQNIRTQKALWGHQSLAFRYGFG